LLSTVYTLDELEAVSFRDRFRSSVRGFNAYYIIAHISIEEGLMCVGLPHFATMFSCNDKQEAGLRGLEDW
jgi:hypothetical protein